MSRWSWSAFTSEFLSTTLRNSGVNQLASNFSATINRLSAAAGEIIFVDVADLILVEGWDWALDPLAIDLTSLAIGIWFNIMEPELQKLPSTLGYILLFTTAIAPFIAILPVDRSLWQKRIYIILALIIISIANHYRLFTDNLNFIFLFKGCFLLPRWEIISIAIMSLTASITSFVIRARYC